MKASSDQKTVLSMLDVVGSTIVDIFFNHLFDRSIAMHEKTSRGLAECYRTAIIDYTKESGSPKFYSILLNSIHHYTRMSTIYTDITYQDCITLYSSMFIPQMYVNSLTIEQRVNILSMILGNVVRAFGGEIIQSHIAVIVDDHSDPTNVEVLQDCILEILLKERDTSYEKFIQSQKPNKKVAVAKPKQQKPILKFVDAYKKSVGERAVLKKKNSALERKNKAITQQFEELRSMFLKQIVVQKEQTRVIQELQQQAQESQQAQELQQAQSTYADDDDGLFSVQYVEA